VSGGDTPPHVLFGRKVRYLPSVVREWLTDRPVYRSTSERALHRNTSEQPDAA
jgi:hypothetical protein